MLEAQDRPAFCQRAYEAVAAKSLGEKETLAEKVEHAHRAEPEEDEINHSYTASFLQDVVRRKHNPPRPVFTGDFQHHGEIGKQTDCQNDKSNLVFYIKNSKHKILTKYGVSLMSFVDGKSISQLLNHSRALSSVTGLSISLIFSLRTGPRIWVKHLLERPYMFKSR